ncbi:ECF transporter S component [Candidatus Mcinerneyibacteriota bacterium]|nr:ECF transporter S component [Candidatus Mcinerneyibacteriota bacterium]
MVTQRQKIRRFTSLGIFTSLVIIMTLFARIPMPQIKGYINLGDSMILLGTLFFGGVFGAVIGSFGSALADVIGGYPNFAIFTFIIKGIEPLIFALLIRAGQKRDYSIPRLLYGATFAMLWMVAGYFWVEYFMFGAPAAFAEVPGNIIQAAGSIFISVGLYNIVRNTVKASA